MADALEGIDLGEMVGILAQTEPQHSQATDDVFVDLNDIISNVMTDAERSALQGKRAWLAAEDEQLRLAVEKHGNGVLEAHRARHTGARRDRANHRYVPQPLLAHHGAE